MLKSVIFDLDGVIIDSEPLHYEVNLLIFNRFNVKISDEEYLSFIGKSNKQIWTYIKEKNNIGIDTDELVDMQLKENINYLHKYDLKPIDGVYKLIKDLKEHDIPLGVASSSPMAFIDEVLNLFDLKKYFDKIVSGENIKFSKPNPDIFLLTARGLDIDSKCCAVIEDSTNGVLASKAAGMKCIGYYNPNSGKQDLSKADVIIDDFNKINFNSIKDLFQ